MRLGESGFLQLELGDPMNLRNLILVGVAIGAAGLWIWRQTQLQRLRAEIRDLGMRHGSLAMALRSVDAAAASIDTNELTRLRGLRSELAKLRGSLPELRQMARQTPAPLEAEAAALEKEAALVRAELAADERSKQVAQNISLAQDLVIAAAQSSGGLLADSWEAVRASADGRSHHESKGPSFLVAESAGGQLQTRRLDGRN